MWRKHIGCVVKGLGRWLGDLLIWLLPFEEEPAATCAFCQGDTEDQSEEEEYERLVVSLDQDSDGSSIGAFL